MTDDDSKKATSVNMSEATSKDQVFPGPSLLDGLHHHPLVYERGDGRRNLDVDGQPVQVCRSCSRIAIVPWVEQSPLDPIDKEEILETLDTVIQDLRDEKYNDRQLARLNSRVTESPILQWGVIQQAENRIQSSGLSDQEKSASALELDRLLRSAAEGKLSLQQMEFIVQPIATKERLSGKLSILDRTTDANLQDFLRRAKSITDNYKIPSEEYPKSVSQVFRSLIDDAKVTD